MSGQHHLEFLHSHEVNDLPLLQQEPQLPYRLSRIRVTNLWDTSIGWDLRFDEDLVAFMIGKNGTGKTTFLELIDGFINGTDKSQRIHKEATSQYKNRSSPRELKKIDLEDFNFTLNPHDPDDTADIEDRFRYTLGRIAWSIDSNFWEVQRLAFSPFLKEMNEHQFGILEFTFSYPELRGKDVHDVEKIIRCERSGRRSIRLKLIDSDGSEETVDLLVGMTLSIVPLEQLNTAVRISSLISTINLRYLPMDRLHKIANNSPSMLYTSFDELSEAVKENIEYSTSWFKNQWDQWFSMVTELSNALTECAQIIHYGQLDDDYHQSEDNEEHTFFRTIDMYTRNLTFKDGDPEDFHGIIEELVLNGILPESFYNDHDLILNALNVPHEFENINAIFRDPHRRQVVALESHYHPFNFDSAIEFILSLDTEQELITRLEDLVKQAYGHQTWMYQELLIRIQESVTLIKFINENFDDKTAFIDLSKEPVIRFSPPTMTQEEERGFSLNDLSSGEKHLITMAWTAISMGPPAEGRNDLIMIDEPELSLWLHRQQSLLADLRDLLNLDADAEKIKFGSTLRIWQKQRQHPSERESIESDVDTSKTSKLSLARRHLIVASHSPYVKGVRDVFTPVNEEEE